MAGFTLIRVVIFVAASIFITVLSWRSLHNPRCHGFYRFFAFESISTLILLNLPFWIRNPLALRQLVSWLLLLASLYFVLQGVYLLRKLGGYQARANSSETFAFEDTAALVTGGIYKYVRHPLYSSLLLLAWGAYLKNISVYATLAVLCATAALIATAKVEERENMQSFGPDYESYIRKTKMFIPYVF